MIRKILDIAVVTSVLVSGAAFADVDSSTVNTQTATLSFGGLTIANHTLTPVSDLPLELSANQTVANGSVTINGDQNIAYVALRWTPDYNGQLPSTSNNTDATISGQSDDSHKLGLALVYPGTFTSVSGTKWIRPTGFNNGDTEYAVSSKNTTTVFADSYNISVDAAIYTQ